MHVPVTVKTIENGNVLSGTFRLEFDGEMTNEIPFDADASLFKSRVESLSSLGLTLVPSR